MLPTWSWKLQRALMLAKLPLVVVEARPGPGRPRTLDYGQVARLLAVGFSQSEVAGRMGVARSTVNSAVRRSGDLERAIQRLHAMTSGQRALPHPDFKR